MITTTREALREAIDSFRMECESPDHSDGLWYYLKYRDGEYITGCEASPCTFLDSILIDSYQCCDRHYKGCPDDYQAITDSDLDQLIEFISTNVTGGQYVDL